MNTNGIIFNSIAAAAKVVFNHLEIAPGTYTAAQIWRALNGDTKEIKSITVNKDIYNYNWENLGPQFTKKEGNGGIYITVGSFSCGIGPESVFEVLPKFAKIAGLPSAEISAALKFTREDSAALSPVCSFAMPCPGSKLAKCAAADELRPVMNTVCLDPAGYLVASDGYILQVMPVFLNIETADELREIAMPSAIIKNAKNGEKVTIYTTGEKYIIKTAQETAEEVTSDYGKYPNWRSVIPAKMQHVATFTKKQITSYQKSAAKIAGKTPSNLFVYKSGEGVAEILADDFDMNKSYKVTLEAADVRAASFGMSSALLGRMVVVGKTFNMYFLEHTRCIIFVDDKENLTLLQPLLINCPEDYGLDLNDMPNYNDSADLVPVFVDKKQKTADDEKTAAAIEKRQREIAEEYRRAEAVTVEEQRAALSRAAALCNITSEDTTEDTTTAPADDYAEAVAALVFQESAALSDEDRAALFADDADETTEEDTTAAPAADDVNETAEDTTAAPAAVAVEMATAAEETTEDTTEEEETTATRRASLFIRAAMWLHQYAAALIVVALPLFVLYCISKTETPAAAMMHTTATAAAKIITDAAAPGDTTTAPAVAALAASPADSVAAPGNITTATPSASHIEKDTTTAAAPAAADAAAAPSLSPDDLAAMYAAYLAAVEDTPAPVLSDAAEETAEDDTPAAAVYLATVHGDFVSVPTAAAATVAATTAPDDLSTFAATPGAPSIIPAF